MVEQELITTIKRIGVASGEVQVFYASSDPLIFIEFYDEDSGVSFTLETVQLGRLCHIKETYVIGNINMDKIKTSAEAEAALKLLTEQGEGMKNDLLVKARQYAEEITKRAGIPVAVVDEIQGEPGLMTEHDQNMWHAGEVLRGIDDDYWEIKVEALKEVIASKHSSITYEIKAKAAALIDNSLSRKY